MGLAVVTVAAGGLPVVESTAGGTPVTEAANGYGVPVTKVTGGKPGLPVVFETIGTGGGGTTYATFDGTVANATLSNENLTVTHSSTVTNSGTRSTALKNSGKYYFEVTVTQRSANDVLGIATAAASFSQFVTSLQQCAIVIMSTGVVWANNGNSGLNIAAITNGNVICCAVDFDLDKVWFRKSGGLWNGLASGSQNPGTSTGGASISTYSATTMAPVIGFGPGVAGDNMTANFGASAFVGAVPAGFTSGWPA